MIQTMEQRWGKDYETEGFVGRGFYLSCYLI